MFFEKMFPAFALGKYCLVETRIGGITYGTGWRGLLVSDPTMTRTELHWRQNICCWWFFPIFLSLTDSTLVGDVMQNKWSALFYLLIHFFRTFRELCCITSELLMVLPMMFLSAKWMLEPLLKGEPLEKRQQSTNLRHCVKQKSFTGACIFVAQLTSQSPRTCRRCIRSSYSPCPWSPVIYGIPCCYLVLLEHLANNQLPSCYQVEDWSELHILLLGQVCYVPWIAGRGLPDVLGCGIFWWHACSIHISGKV